MQPLGISLSNHNLARVLLPFISVASFLPGKVVKKRSSPNRKGTVIRLGESSSWAAGLSPAECWPLIYKDLLLQANTRFISFYRSWGKKRREKTPPHHRFSSIHERFATLTLWGDVEFSLAIAWICPGLPKRRAFSKCLVAFRKISPASLLARHEEKNVSKGSACIPGS